MADEKSSYRIEDEQRAQIISFKDSNPVLCRTETDAVRALIGDGLAANGYDPGTDLTGSNGETVTDGGFTDYSFLTLATATMLLLTIVLNAWAWFVQTEFLTSLGLSFMGITAIVVTIWLGELLYNHATGRKAGV